MDPVTIVGLVEGSIGLVVKCGSVTKSLNTIVGQYKHAPLTLSLMVENLNMMQCAWDRIRVWSKDYVFTDNDGLMNRLERFLETGILVLDALEKDLKRYDSSKLTFRQRSRLLWNEGTLQAHRNRIRDQAQSMGLLLQAVQLPTIQGTADLLQQSQKQFRKSDESAFSIAPSKLSSRHSSSSINTGDQESIRSFKSLFRRGFSFEKDLLTTRVYKRNYGDSKSQEPCKQKHGREDNIVAPQKETPHKETPQSSVVQQPLVTTFSNVSTNRDYGDLVEACSTGDKDEVSRILEDASTCGDANALILLLGRKCDSVHPCPVHATVFGGDVDVMESLAQYAAHLKHEISTNSGTLWFCTGRKYVMALEKKYRSVLPLHVAAYKGHLSMVQLLLRIGAPISAESDHGVQAIHLAAKVGSMDVLAALIAAGASVNCRDYRKRQPIHYISGTRDRPEVIRYLAENGAEIEAVSHMSQPTALSLACRKDLIENAKVLLSLGAVITRPTLDTAVRHGMPALVDVLLYSVASQEEGQSILAACLRKYLFAFVSRGMSRWDGSWDNKNLRLLLQHTDLIVKDRDGHTVLYGLFHESWVTHEKRLELEELFLRYLPNTKSLEKNEIRSIVSREKKALSANGKRASTDGSASSDESQGQSRPYSLRSQGSTSQGSVYSTTSLL